MFQKFLFFFFFCKLVFSETRYISTLNCSSSVEALEVEVEDCLTHILHKASLTCQHIDQLFLISVKRKFDFVSNICN